MVRIEFVGGPKCGEHEVVDEVLYEYRLVKPVGFEQFLNNTPALSHVVVTYGVYCRNSGTNDFYWQGWRE